MRWFPVLWLLLSALLPPLPALGAELKVATWNVEWLTARPQGDPALPKDVVPKGPADLARMARYAEMLAADVVALQEVDGPEMAARLFPAGRYHIHITKDHVVQRVGFAVRQGLAFTANPDLVSLDTAHGAGRHLRSGADITLDLPGAKLRLLAVHLKSGCRQDPLAHSARPECATLRLQLVAMQGWLAQRRGEGVPFAIVGDFNRWMDNGDAFWAGLRQAAPLVRATEGASSPCWGGGGFIDHVIAGGPAQGWLVPGSLKVMVYRETAAGMKAHLSDHCPVSALFRIP